MLWASSQPQRRKPERYCASPSLPMCASSTFDRSNLVPTAAVDSSQNSLGARVAQPCLTALARSTLPPSASFPAYATMALTSTDPPSGPCSLK